MLILSMCVSNALQICKCDVDVADCKASPWPEASALYPPRIFLQVTVDSSKSQQLECPLELIGTPKKCTFMLTSPQPSSVAVSSKPPQGKMS